MTPDDENKVRVREKFAHELKELLAIFLYLALFFCAFTTYRRIVLREVGLSYYHYGFALIQAIVLAKVILIGEAAKIGRLFEDRPLIIPTLYKVVVFSILTIIFGLVERLVGAWVHGTGLAGVLHEIAGPERNEILGRALVVLSAFIPFFAFKEIGRVLGEGALAGLFLHRQPPSNPG
jgi:hypothetical protein